MRAVVRRLRVWTALAVTVLSLLLSPTSLQLLHAVQPDEILADSSLEARARALSRMLRCMVCQNQSIDDSDAPLARDLRLLVRERLVAGDTDEQVLDFLVARYGEFVLLKPLMTWHTAILWLGPPALLLGGGLVLVFLRRRKQTNVATGAIALTAAEEARLNELLNSEKR
jgi:cytochrome c-type biogenesis protein CcmH